MRYSSLSDFIKCWHVSSNARNYGLAWVSVIALPSWMDVPYPTEFKDAVNELIFTQEKE